MSDDKKCPVPVEVQALIAEVTGTPYEHAEDCAGHSSKSGPSKVNSPAFKSGWDTVFGAKVPVGEA